MKKKLFTGLSIGMLLLAPIAAQATLTTYNDRSLFNLAVGSTTLIDFEAQQQRPGQFTYYGENLTVNGVSFTQADNRLFVIDPNRYLTSGTNYLNNNTGYFPVIISFASYVSAVGMDLGWLADGWTSSTGGKMDIVLNNGESFTTSVVGPLDATSIPLGFVGFSSDKPFSSFYIVDPSESTMIDNFAYTAKSSAPTPEPASMLLLGTDLAALAGARKLKKQQQPA